MRHILFYLAFNILSIPLVIGQKISSSEDSIQTQKAQTEVLLRKALEKSLSGRQNQDQYFNDLEVSELIVNAVISKPGNDFFDSFTEGFAWPEVNGGFIIIISEKPAQTNNTQITIMLNDLEVFQNSLQPRASYLQELAQYAQEVTKNYILNYQQIMRDLDGNDRSGSGIY